MYITNLIEKIFFYNPPSKFFKITCKEICLKMQKHLQQIKNIFIENKWRSDIFLISPSALTKAEKRLRAALPRAQCLGGSLKRNVHPVCKNSPWQVKWVFFKNAKLLKYPLKPRTEHSFCCRNHWYNANRLLTERKRKWKIVLKKLLPLIYKKLGPFIHSGFIHKTTYPHWALRKENLKMCCFDKGHPYF